jgi:O-antigen/teichoic acid export membrane protein
MPDDQDSLLTDVDVTGENLPIAFLSYFASAGTLIIGQIAQLIAFVVLARHLGVEQFGYLMIINAVTAIPVTLCGLGANEALIRRVARDPRAYPALLGHNFILIGASGVVLTIAATVVMYFLIRVSADPLRNLLVIFIFALSNVVLLRCFGLLEEIYIAHRLFMRANIVNVSYAAARALTAALACIGFGVDQLETWGYWWGCAHIIGFPIFIAAAWQLGAPQWRVLRDELRRGILNCTPVLSEALRLNIDRLALSLVASPGVIAAYSAASRMVQSSLIGIWSFTRLLYPRLAVAGSGDGGVVAAYHLGLRYFAVMLTLGILISVSLFIVAPYMPLVFGKAFADSVFNLKVLCWLPILAAIQSSAYDALGAAEKHAARALFTNITGGLGAAIIVGMTYFFGIVGTFVGVFVAQGLTCVSVWIPLIVLSRREKKRATAARQSG